MRLLVVMPSYPFPPRIGSTIFAYNNIKELSKNNSIFLMCLDKPQELGDLAGCVERVESVGRKKTWFMRSRFYILRYYILHMLIGIPFSVSANMSREMQKKVASVIERNEFDAILVYEMDAVQHCPSVYYKKTIVIIEDPPSIKLRRMFDLPVYSLWKKVNFYIQARLTERYENSILPKVAKVLLLSEEDAKDMREKGRYDNIGCVSYGIGKRSKKEIVGYEERTEGMIVFSGSMFHLPNVDGALFFLQHIFPLVLKDYPKAILWIVGAEPDTRIRDAAVCFEEHVVITGRVNDMSEYLQRAKVSICPVRLKIGVQTKILEALSWGTPVVSTSAGNSGIGGYSGKELWVADEPNIFASRVVALLQGVGWHRLSEEGRKFVEERFSWERSAMELEQHIVHIQTANGGKDVV